MTEEIRTDNTDVVANACKKISELEQENDRFKGQLEQLLKELIDRGIIYEWYVNGDGYYWSYTKQKPEEGDNRIFEEELERGSVSNKDFVYDYGNNAEKVKEKHYRPFKDCDELVEYWERKIFIPVMEYTNTKVLFRPEIWVKSKAYGVDNLITAFDNAAVLVSWRNTQGRSLNKWHLKNINLLILNT